MNQTGSVTVVAKHFGWTIGKLAPFCTQSPSNRFGLLVIRLLYLTAFRARFAGVHWTASSVR